VYCAVVGNLCRGLFYFALCTRRDDVKLMVVTLSNLKVFSKSFTTRLQANYLLPYTNVFSKHRVINIGPYPPMEMDNWR